MISLVNSYTNAAIVGWHLWEIELGFAHGLPPGWLNNINDHPWQAAKVDEARAAKLMAHARARMAESKRKAAAALRLDAVVVRAPCSSL